MEEILEEKKKSKKGLVFTIFLILVIIGLAGYIAYDKGLIELSTKGEVKEEKVSNDKKIALDDNRFYGVYEKLKSYTYTKNRSDGYESFSSKELLNISCDQLKESDFTKTNYVHTFDSENNSPIYAIKGNTIDGYLKEYFGSTLYFNKEDLFDVMCATPNVNFNGSGMSVEVFDNRSDELRVWFSGIGGTTGPHADVKERKIVSATIKDDVITVKEKAIYYTMNANYDHNGINYKIYSDKEKTTEIDNIDFTIDNVVDGKISIDSYEDKASTITQVFKLDKDTNKYYFVSSKIEK